MATSIGIANAIGFKNTIVKEKPLPPIDIFDGLLLESGNLLLFEDNEYVKLEQKI